MGTDSFQHHLPLQPLLEPASLFKLGMAHLSFDLHQKCSAVKQGCGIPWASLSHPSPAVLWIKDDG